MVGYHWLKPNRFELFDSEVKMEDDVEIRRECKFVFVRE